MMASHKKSNETSRSLSKSARRQVGEVIYSSSSSEEDSEVTTGCRSCRNTSKEHFSRPQIDTESLTTGNQDSARREENPFSFKNFFKDGWLQHYQNTGARPKVYSPSASSPHNLDKDTTVYTRNPTELPDFVQDHLVIEQCYLNHESKPPPIPEVDNLPDFAINSVEQRHPRSRHDSKKIESSASCDVPFDLTRNVRRGLPPRNYSLPGGAHSLDLPQFNKNRETIHSSTQAFPLDLPLPDMPIPEAESSINDIARESGESGIPKSLPDFLNDGPIHNRTSVSTDSGISPNISESTERRLLLQIERLQCELEAARKQITQKNKRIHLLESDLASRKAAEKTPHLGMVEEHEDETGRDAGGETNVTSLKKEIKSLTTEISSLRVENKRLRAEMTVASGGEFGSPNVNRTIHRLAGDLRNAASSAEMSLRQLMSGVENLRVLASTLESVDRIEDRTKDFLPDTDEENAAGPAP